ncbi:AAA family ATPase [Mesotoga sp. BH458_6_3_2_1]|uniref:AAA family ATPase n=1 Tax=Mesotoga sp. BH458_6_3_2_1 TaxID=1437446 RepID=UPI000EF2521A|nr:AAA family ATPase [Mesotoga sp. BH458_6_3_2_1]RLL86701.1 hypothetical protein Y697_08215 [Mesotoga sp. BH458_6_3_2_1]
MDNEFQWVPYYEALADKLLEFKDKSGELFNVIKKLSSGQPLMRYLHFEKEDWWGPRQYRIDPFSVLGVMNRGITDANRTLLAKILANEFGVTVTAPTQFAGIPVLDNRRSFFVGNDEMWNLFIYALESADADTFSNEFKEAFDKAVALNGNGLTYVTMGLFWIRPNVFFPLDTNSRKYISEHYSVDVPNTHCAGSEYTEFLGALKNELSKERPSLSFPEMSYKAWIHRKGSQPIIDDSSGGGDDNIDKKLITEKNTILYGPPGTGKTYSAIQYAVAIVEGKSIDKVKDEDYGEVFGRYLKHKDDGTIAFTTFHQSFSYEEFIEGIRPVVSPEEKADAGNEIEYEIHDGIFKAFCDNAGKPVGGKADADLGIGKNPTVWKVSLEAAGDNPTRTECMENNHIRIGWDEYGENISDATDFGERGGGNVLNAFYNRMQIGDIVLSCYSSRTIDAIGVVTGEPEWHKEYQHYRRVRKVRWLVKGINEDIVDLNGGRTMTLSTVYRLSVSVSDVLQMLKNLKPDLFKEKVKVPNRVFIIDEINRGNISKIFGELITLIESSKRLGASEQLRAKLPYSGQNFGVPDNVYIIGTMNTADRSIALIDSALRRRFSFVEMQPDSSTLRDVFVDDVDIAKMLDTINKRITVLLDREHTIGHSYLLPLKNSATIETLAEIFENSIVPLLQEYFYDDYEKIRLVLGDNRKPDDSARFIVKKTDTVDLFGGAEIDFPEYYEVNREAFKMIEAYRQM